MKDTSNPLKKLDFGCGASKKPGHVGADILNLPGVDHIFDFNRFPYPFQDNEFDEIWCDQVLEHLESPIRAVEELHRIAKPGAKITIGVPYFRSFYASIDPTHRNFFGVHWFRYFDPDDIFCQRYQYSKSRLRTDRIEFDREFLKKGLLEKIILWFANKRPRGYEQRLSHLYPLNSLTFYLTTIK